MEVEYTTTKLRKRLTDPQEMVKNFGVDKAKRLKQRLEELQSISTLAELRNFPQANCHELKGDLKGFLALDLSRNWRLLFKPAHNPPPSKPDGGLDWCQVSKICIEAVEDYH
ncbi:MAG: type II toxin-antitoxin system RelE/ParE family toxin [Bacteroidota bacterium]